MDPLKAIQEHIINIQDEKQQENKITHEQQIILFQVHLADVLLFWAWTLNPQQQKQQEELQEQYLKNLKSWDTVEIWLQWTMLYHTWIVINNDS